MPDPTTPTAASQAQIAQQEASYRAMPSAELDAGMTMILGRLYQDRPRRTGAQQDLRDFLMMERERRRRVEAALEAYVAGGPSVDVATHADLDAHTGRRDNPHFVTAVQVGADPAGTAESAVAAHAAAADPHPAYLTTAEGNAAYQPADADLTAIAALATTPYGRALLTLAAAPDARTALALATVAATGAYGDLSGRPTLGTASPLDVAASGNATASQVVKGSDGRLSDARTPTAHAASHRSGGSDAIALDTLGVPTDVTTLNATTARHGLLPKLPGGTALYLRGDGTWVAPPNGYRLGTPATGPTPAALSGILSGNVAGAPFQPSATQDTSVDVRTTLTALLASITFNVYTSPTQGGTYVLRTSDSVALTLAGGQPRSVNIAVPAGHWVRVDAVGLTLGGSLAVTTTVTPWVPV